MNYYNEFDPKVAQWLRNLVAAGLIPQGYVDDRSITEVDPDELSRYTQCHFFAGIGGWSYALQLAGWSPERPVWTGSCPCQPFSTAGKQGAQTDERHLWPIWFNLIHVCKPAVIFGEQVANAITFGWLDEVANDLEAEGYAVAASVLPACSVGAPHKRDRLWFVANTDKNRRNTPPIRGIHTECDTEPHGTMVDTQRNGSHGGEVTRSPAETIRDNTQGQNDTRHFEGTGQSGTLANTQNIICNGGSCGKYCNEGGGVTNHEGQTGTDGCAHSTLANTECFGQSGSGQLAQSSGSTPCGIGETGRIDNVGQGFWNDGQPTGCPDGKQRIIEPRIRLLANGVSSRVVKLRALGNAIVPQVAAEFIKAFMEVEDV